MNCNFIMIWISWWTGCEWVVWVCGGAYETLFNSCMTHLNPKSIHWNGFGGHSGVSFSFTGWHFGSWNPSKGLTEPKKQLGHPLTDPSTPRIEPFSELTRRLLSIVVNHFHFFLAGRRRNHHLWFQHRAKSVCESERIRYEIGSIGV